MPVLLCVILVDVAAALVTVGRMTAAMRTGPGWARLAQARKIAMYEIALAFYAPCAAFAQVPGTAARAQGVAEARPLLQSSLGKGHPHILPVNEYPGR